MIIVMILTIAALLIGTPVAFTLLLSLVLLMFFLNVDISLGVMVQEMYAATDSFPLLALPFFVFSGSLMEKSGMALRLVRFTLIFFGRLKGGLSFVTIGASGFFSSLSGSGVAGAAAIGSIMVPQMEKNGYRRDFSASLTAAANVAGPIIPPSIIMIVYSSMVPVSVGAMFIAGIIPGIMLLLSLMITSYIIAIRQNHPKAEVELSIKNILVDFKDAVLALLMPIIILGGILSGYFTPTEAAVVSIAYALIVGVFIYRSIGIKEIMDCLLSTGKTTGMILFIVAAAQPFGWVLARQQIPQLLVEFMTGITNNPLIILLLLNILMLFMGMILSETANVILLAPLLYPLTTSFGIDPLHFGIVMLFNLTIGLITPPFGVNLFVMNSIAKVPLDKIFKGIVPFVLSLVIALLLITYLPSIVLFLPRLLGLYN